MTAGEFSGVDHDLLADYVGGALDGTPQQAVVARLVEEDPAWGEAYAALARAVELVHADLADWAAAPVPPMTPTVADRITAALAGAGPAPTTGATRSDADEQAGASDRIPAPRHADAGDLPAEPGDAARGTTPVMVPTPVAGAARRAGGAARPVDGPGRNTGPGRRSRRWSRLAGPVALAAASVTAVGLGVSRLADLGSGDGTADSAAGSAAAPMTAPYRTVAPVRSSGTDYTPERLSAGGGAETTLAGPSLAGPQDTAVPEKQDDGRLPAVGGLDRLTRPEALRSCLGAISGEHGSDPVTFDLVDYASFRGQPALVVTFADAGGVRWAWVSGPECGVPGSGADTRFRTRVG